METKYEPVRVKERSQEVQNCGSLRSFSFPYPTSFLWFSIPQVWPVGSESVLGFLSLFNFCTGIEKNLGLNWFGTNHIGEQFYPSLKDSKEL